MKIKNILAIKKDEMIELCKKIIAPIRKKKITSTSFSIISNNCWGGKVYQRYGLQYLSPTIGLYFFADDYIKFVKKLKYYINIPIEIIQSKNSKYYEILKQRNQLTCPIGKLDDIEIVFLHYKSASEAIEKWERRKKRINWENLIIKFSQMNYCETKHLLEFDKIDYKTKFVFVNSKQLSEYNVCRVYFKGFEEKKGVLDDTTKYCNYIDINSLVSNRKIIKTRTNFLN